MCNVTLLGDPHLLGGGLVWLSLSSSGPTAPQQVNTLPGIFTHLWADRLCKLGGLVCWLEFLYVSSKEDPTEMLKMLLQTAGQTEVCVFH